MIIFLLGSLDIIFAISSILMGYGIYSHTMMLVVSLFLIAKGIIFIKSWASILEVLSGLALLIALSYGLPLAVFWIVGIYLLQKGIFSFL